MYFSHKTTHDPPRQQIELLSYSALEITEEERANTVERMISRQTSPRSDGIPGKVLAITSNYLRKEIKGLFNGCLEKGRFPDIWKTAGFVLIPKPGKTNWEAPSSIRPICSINEVRRMMEKIIADRIWTSGPRLSEKLIRI